jgi:hypothetical protein
MLALLLAFAGQAAEATTPETIPIYACISVPQGESTPARYRELAEAGFTTSLTGFSSVAEALKAMDAAKGTGVTLFITCPELKRDTAATVRALSGHPALAGYHLEDEPSAAKFAGLAAWQKSIQEIDAAHPCYINLLPVYASPQQLGAKDYKDYVDQFIMSVQPPLLSFDNYPTSSGKLEPHLYTNLEIVAAAARSARKPFWGFYQAVLWDTMPARTLAQLRVESYSNLAYGAQCIQVFTYWMPGFPAHRDAPIDLQGKRTPAYTLVKQVNGEIRAWSRVFKDARVLGVTHAGKSLPPGSQPFAAKAGLASLDVGAGGAVVSFLEKAGRSYVALVNKDLHDTLKITIAFDDPKKVLELRKDGQDRPVIAAEFTIDPGDLLVFQFPGSRTYTESDAIFPNPERGLFLWTDFAKTPDFSGLAAKGYRIVHGLVHLDSYRDAPLSPAFLQTLGERFAAVRKAGMKVLLRFAYDFTEKGQDAPKERVLEHLAQLKPLFAANEDVIVAMEAGFIGAWGEWHSSKNKLDQPEARKEILTAVLDALPKSRLVKIRTPGYAKTIFGDEPVTEAEAYSGSDKARVGHHNDCFLAGEDDAGTYWPGPREPLKKYAETWTKHTVMSGETCRLSPPRSDGKTALVELARFHWSMLHEGYHPDVIKAWKSQGAWDEIQKRLGYRFVLREASWPASVAKGGTFTLAVTLKNAGFASMFNERKVYAVFTDGAKRHVSPLEGVDPRRWWGGEETKLSANVTAPAEAGTYRLSLWLPDAAAALRDRPEYAVRFANGEVWDPKTGENVLAAELKIGP